MTAVEDGLNELRCKKAKPHHPTEVGAANTSFPGEFEHGHVLRGPGGGPGSRSRGRGARPHFRDRLRCCLALTTSANVAKASWRSGPRLPTQYSAQSVGQATKQLALLQNRKTPAGRNGWGRLPP